MFQRCGLEYSAVAGRVGDDGREGVRRLPRAVGLRREHARDLRERRLRGRSRDRARHPARSGASRTRCDAPKEVATPGVDDHRGACGVPRASTLRRPRRRCQSSRPTGRSCSGSSVATTASRSRRCSARSRATTVLRRTTRSERRSARAAARSGRSASTWRSSRTRRFARGSSSRARTETAGICSASRRDATIEPRSRTSARRARATRARSAAARFASRPRSRSGTSSSSTIATRRRSEPRSSTRTERRSR